MHFDWSELAPLLAVVHVLGILAACHAILNTRTSQGAIAWAVSLATMPYLTLIPYLFLGRSKFAGYVDARRLRNETLRERAHRSEPDPSQPQLRGDAAAEQDSPAYVFDPRVLHTLSRLAGMPLVPGNSVRTLVNGEATFAAILEAIEQARHYVIVQFFIVRADALGNLLKDAMIAAAARGVRVFFLYDSIGCFDLPAHYTGALNAGRVVVHPFSTRRHFVNRFQLNFRNHRKIVVVDGERAFVGGHNVGVEYLGAKAPLSPWRDTHIEVRGPAVRDIQFVFTEDWYWATQKLPECEQPQQAPQQDGMFCLVLPTGPADRMETCSLFFVEAINAARKRLWITTPYLVPDEAVFSALRLAVLRGVDVRILIPARRDHYVVFEASTLYAFDLARAGIRISRYQPGFLHQKVVLIDDVAAAVGSANLDNRSFRLNFEITVLTVHRGFAAEVEAMLARDFEESVEIDRHDYRRVPALRKITMHVARLFAPIL